MADQEIVSETTVVVVHIAEQREDKPARVRMNKKAKLRAIAELRHGHNANLNIYDVPRKLLIFDVNKVLLFRQPKSPRYQVRPYAHEFIKGMSERYTIGVWTSMTKRFAVPILAELFPPGGPQLKFQWYQNRCRAIHGDNVDDKPIFLKELHRVWGEHRMFNDSNTILVDDSSEKCTRNAPWTSIHPLPYEPFAPRPPYPPTPAPVPASAGSSGAGEAMLRGVASGESVTVAGAAGKSRSRSPSPSRSADTDGDAPASIASGADVAILPMQAFWERDSAMERAHEEDHVQDQDHGHSGRVNGVGQRTASPTPSSASIEHRRDARTDSAEIDISDVTVQGSDAYRIHTSAPGSHRDRDCELKPDGPLWVYLDRIAQYDGHVRDIYDLCGPYKHST